MSTTKGQDDAFAAAGISTAPTFDPSGLSFEDHLAALVALGDQVNGLTQPAQKMYRTGMEHDEQPVQDSQGTLDSELTAESTGAANLSDKPRTSQFQKQPVRQSNDGSGREDFAPAQAEYDNGLRYHTTGISTFDRFAPSADSLNASCAVPAISTIQTDSMHGIGDDCSSFGGHQVVPASASPRTRFGGTPLAATSSGKRKVTESFARQDASTKRRTMTSARGHVAELADGEDKEEMWAYSARPPSRQTLQEVLQAAQQPANVTRPIIAGTSQRWRPFVPTAPAHSTRSGTVAGNDQTTTASAARMAFTAQTIPAPSGRPQLSLAKMTALPNSNTSACADRIAAWNPEMRSTDVPQANIRLPRNPRIPVSAAELAYIYGCHTTWSTVMRRLTGAGYKSRELAVIHLHARGFPVDDDSFLRHNNQARQQKEAMGRAEFAMYADWTETRYPKTLPEFDSYDVSTYPPPRDITVHDDTLANLGRSMVNFPPPEDQWFLSMAIQYVLAHNDETSTPADIWDMAVRESWAAPEGSLMPGSDVAGHARVVAALGKDQILKGRRRRNA
ncbi:hypothetical protein LTR56_017395 [Elasticomyces elasticus]|nr:hypothetical protein LTR56_017395 [Elasticomyces elasticus]KAK3639079.1 hypothetical protein LTR22_017607 [Elasticomyces elasticus]